ncbi:MAG: pyridoxal phosphate-dependent aminotransferase [Rhodothermales bacterium]|nr:pyridoxal phosphate-dependent aminotransferase [Rhodothermales bacterium]
MKQLATRTDALEQSGIRAISKLINEVDGINLGQGICDMPVPTPIKSAAHAAIDGDESIYSHFAGVRELRSRIAAKIRTYNKIPIESEENIVVSVGSTGAFVTAMMALLNPGDEVLLFEPYYGYHKHIIELIGGSVTYAPIDMSTYSVDFNQVREAISENTKAILITTPANPSGKVWSHEECLNILSIAHELDLYIITDEIYEYMLYDGAEHLSIASMPTAYDRTITLSGFSKTYNMTGWRLGYAVAPTHIAEKMGLINDLVYICAPTPLQHALVAAFDMSESYYSDLRAAYLEKRNMMCDTLERCGFNLVRPQGSYYILADYSKLRQRFDGFDDDMSACKTLISMCGIGTVPGRSFFSDPQDGNDLLRFCYAKELDVLTEACKRLEAAFTQPAQ